MTTKRKEMTTKTKKIDRTEYFKELDRTEYYRELRFKKKYGNAKRICAEEGCGTVLNSYNFNECCSLHNFAYVVKHKVKIHIGNKHQ